MPCIQEKRKIPKFLSPSALSRYKKDPIDYYKRYCTDLPREPQTQPMAAGSAFDAKVKSEIGRIFEVEGVLSYEEELERQVEKNVHAFAERVGIIIFEAYRRSGAYTQLLTILDKATNIQLECRNVFTLIDDVKVMEVPDLLFDLDIPGFEKTSCVLDWKVNGFCSAGSTTPQKGYVNILDASVGYVSRGANKPHKESFPKSLPLGRFQFYDSSGGLNKSVWADQLRTYCFEREHEKKFILVDQVCGSEEKMRVAQHRCFLSDDEGRIVKSYKALWNRLRDEHFFVDLSLTDSIKMEEDLHRQAELFNNEEFDWFRKLLS